MALALYLHIAFVLCTCNVYSAPHPCDIVILCLCNAAQKCIFTGISEVRSKETVIYEGFIRKKNTSTVVGKALETFNIKCKLEHKDVWSV